MPQNPQKHEQVVNLEIQSSEGRKPPHPVVLRTMVASELIGGLSDVWANTSAHLKANRRRIIRARTSTLRELELLYQAKKSLSQTEGDFEGAETRKWTLRRKRIFAVFAAIVIAFSLMRWMFGSLLWLVPTPTAKPNHCACPIIVMVRVAARVSRCPSRPSSEAGCMGDHHLLLWRGRFTKPPHGLQSNKVCRTKRFILISRFGSVVK